MPLRHGEHGAGWAFHAGRLRARCGLRDRAWPVVAAVVVALQLVASGAQPAAPDLAALLARAHVQAPVGASCRGEFRLGHGNEYAVAVLDSADRGRYLVVRDDGGSEELATFSGKPDLACHTLREADRLNATIAASATINGRVTAEWDGMVICGFIEPTIAVCWQFAPEERKFVRIGGWTT